MTVILLRHGRSTANTAHTLAGRSEGVDLDDKGLAQARSVVDRIGDLPVRALVTSPLLRCQRTLEPLADHLGLEIADSVAFTEGGAGPVALDAALEAAADGRTLAVCSHGDVLPAVAAAAVRRGADIEGGQALKKAARYDCTVEGGQLIRLVAVGPPDGTT